MMTIKQIYDIKIALANNNHLDKLEELLREEGVTPVVNNNRTIRIDSSEGIDKISKCVDNSIPKWYGKAIDEPISFVYNLLPLSAESCMLHL